MLDAEIADQGAEILATAASSLCEDGADLAARAFRTPDQVAPTAAALQTLGQDVAALAAAIEVLARRQEAPPA